MCYSLQHLPPACNTCHAVACIIRLTMACNTHPYLTKLVLACITHLLRPLGWEPLIYRQSGRGPGKRTPWKSSDQPTRGHVTVKTYRWLDAVCMKYQDNLTSLDAGCRKHQDSLTSLDTVCMKYQDNLTSLDAGYITWWDCRDNLDCLDRPALYSLVIVPLWNDHLQLML